MIFIIRDHKLFTSAVTGLAAVVLFGSMSFGQFFGVAEAQEYDAAENTAAAVDTTANQEEPKRELNLDAMVYGPYEQMTEEQRRAYVVYQQNAQELQRHRMNSTQNSRTVVQENKEQKLTALSISLETVDQVEAEQARILEEQSKVWHNPLVLDTYVSSPFGMRWHPVYGYYRMHNGVDLDSDYGDEIRAARAGTVADTGWNEYYGYYVIIDHGDGFESEYFHLSRYFVDEGQEVQACEIIGLVGSTGVSTGAHLHFGLLYEGNYVDPEDYINFE